MKSLSLYEAVSTEATHSSQLYEKLVNKQGRFNTAEDLLICGSEISCELTAELFAFCSW